jgi:biofilm PGA synthesis N-glycosyltransferase PgaC
MLFTLRRWLFVLASFLPAIKDNNGQTPDVLLLVPVRNEAAIISDLLAALGQLAYPEDALTVVFVDDGSTDDSTSLIKLTAAQFQNWHVLTLPRNIGKANALNAALDQYSQAEIIAIYDADERPQPRALLYLVQPFATPQVGGVSGRRAIQNALASPAASYTTFEGLVHQLITMRAKDRLRLGPALLGSNCAYRRTALVQVGGFRSGALLEDSDLTLRLNCAGWQTRFVADSVSYHQTPESLPGYWRQHTRWARGFNEVAKEQGSSILAKAQLSIPLRLELLLFSLGYLDRLALLAGVILALLKNRLALWAVGLSLFTPWVQVVAALKIANEPPAMWWRIIWLPIFFGVDIAMALAGFWNTLRQTPKIWEERRHRETPFTMYD